MIERPVTPMTYAREMAAMSWRHSSELAAAVACGSAFAVAAFIMLSARLLVVLLPPALAAVVIVVAAMAAWRLHHRQRTALATTRTLLGLNIASHAELECHLRARYQRREARIHERNEVRMERLAGEMDALRTAVLDRSYRRVAM
jgi:hypothetical protein